MIGGRMKTKRLGFKIKFNIPWYKRMFAYRKIGKYEKYVVKMVEEEMKKCEKEFTKCLNNQMIYGFCNGSCGGDWHHETP